MLDIVRHMRYRILLRNPNKAFGRARSRKFIADWCDQRDGYRKA